MKILRVSAVFGIAVVLGVAVTVIIRQQHQIRSLRESQRSLLAQYQQISATNALLLSVKAEGGKELIRLQRQSLEVLSLRNQLTLARNQLAATSAVAAKDQTSRMENPNESAGYVAKEQLKYAGFDTPQDAFQSMRWASAHGDYTNWLTTLAPALQEEELANPRSLDEFQHSSASEAGYVGVQVLATKPVGSDRIELKVRLDTENSAKILIYPMVAIGNEWRLGDEIHSYTSGWDNPDGTQ